MAKHRGSVPVRRDPRSILRARLERIQAVLIAANGEEAAAVMARSFGFDRLAPLDASDPVRVVGYEIDLPADLNHYVS